MRVNDVITMFALISIGGVIVFMLIGERFAKIESLKKKFKYGKEESKKSEETKKAGRINARGKW